MNMKKQITNFVLNLVEIIDSSSEMNEEGRKMRRTRLKKFKKKSKGLIIAAQLISIWYLLIITGSYLTSETGAYFNDVEVIENSLHVGEWDVDEWDKSSLDFDGSTVRVDGCTVFSTIRNTGEDMTFSTWRYYLYKADEYLTGEPVATGTVPKLAAKETGEISAEVLEPGEYKFAVRRPLNRPGNNNQDEDGYSYIRSDNTITVTETNCNVQLTAEENEVITNDDSTKKAEELENELKEDSTKTSDDPETESNDDSTKTSEEPGTETSDDITETSDGPETEPKVDSTETLEEPNKDTSVNDNNEINNEKTEPAQQQEATKQSSEEVPG